MSHATDIVTVCFADDAIEHLTRLRNLAGEVYDAAVEAMAQCLVTARLEGRFDDAVAASGMSRTRCLQLTREWNEKSGRSIRWSDGLDPVNSSFTG